MAGKLTCVLLRVVQLLFAAIVLGLSIHAIKWQGYHSTPATTGFASFTGAFGAFAALMGLAAVWISPLSGVVMAFIDCLGSVFFLAGGIAFAVGLHGIDCSNPHSEKTWHNKLISGGCILKEDEQDWYCAYPGPVNSDGIYYDAVEQRCRLVEADAAFLFLGFCVSLAAAILCLQMVRAKKKGISNV